MEERGITVNLPLNEEGWRATGVKGKALSCRSMRTRRRRNLGGVGEEA
jgi:hypothetical protein